MKALVLFNPAAGRIPVAPFVHNAAKALTRLGWQVDLESTLSGAQATERAKQALPHNPQNAKWGRGTSRICSNQSR